MRHGRYFAPNFREHSLAQILLSFLPTLLEIWHRGTLPGLKLINTFKKIVQKIGIFLYCKLYCQKYFPQKFFPVSYVLKLFGGKSIIFCIWHNIQKIQKVYTVEKCLLWLLSLSQQVLLHRDKHCDQFLKFIF